EDPVLPGFEAEQLRSGKRGVVAHQITGMADLEMRDALRRLEELDLHHAGKLAGEQSMAAEQHVATGAERIILVERAIDDPYRIRKVALILVDGQSLDHAGRKRQR